MKSTLKSFLCSFVLIAVMSAGVMAAEKQKNKVVTIQTSAICGSCKARIERVLKASDGVEEALLNLNSKKVKVKYDPSKTSPEKLREIIANTGYNADEVKRSEEAYEKLPLCCQKVVPGDTN